MSRYWISTIISIALLVCGAAAQDAPSHDKNLDVTSPMGDLHVGKDANAQKAGLPLYPGARPKQDPDNDPLNLGILTDSFGIKLVVAKYETDDPAAKVLEFYREKMRKYGKVLECHNTSDDTDVHSDDDSDLNKPLKCEGNNSGPVRELKVGTEGNAHIVAIENPENSKGTTFAIVYVHRRGKTGDI
jgi:hypothetical protein